MHDSDATVTISVSAMAPSQSGELLQHSRSYPGRPDQVREVRAFLREVLAGCPRADDAVMVGSELAANSALHSRSATPGGVFTVRAEVREGDCTYIAVEDAGGRWAPGTLDIVPEHGLDVVQGLAGQGNWGITGDETGRQAWARLPWPTPSRAPDAPANQKPTADPASLAPNEEPTADPSKPAAELASKNATTDADPGADLARLAAEVTVSGAVAGGESGAGLARLAAGLASNGADLARLVAEPIASGAAAGGDPGAGLAGLAAGLASKAAATNADPGADLARLAAELTANGLWAQLIVPVGGPPFLEVTDTELPGPPERVFAQADWYFWPTAERIAARDDLATAARAIARILRAHANA